MYPKIKTTDRTFPEHPGKKSKSNKGRTGVKTCQLYFFMLLYL